MGLFKNWFLPFKEAGEEIIKKTNAPITREIKSGFDRMEEKIDDLSFGNEKESSRILTSNNLKTNFRPLSFKDYIGQEKAKQMIAQRIKGVQERNHTFPHTLIHGKAGCGKTTLAKIIAIELGVPFLEILSSKIEDMVDLFEILEKVSNGVLFMDEIHRLERDSAERLYSIMEDFRYEHMEFEPFTLIGATTEIGEIIENRKPFVDRFKLKIKLEDYTESEIEKIVLHYVKKVFPDDTIKPEDLKIIARNCRLTPRIGNALADDVIYGNDVHTTLNNMNIIDWGYTRDDMAVLDILNQASRAMGLNAIASSIDASKNNYINEIEPFLVKNGDIIRTGTGRIISEQGKVKLRQLKEKLASR